MCPGYILCEVGETYNLHLKKLEPVCPAGVPPGLPSLPALHPGGRRGGCHGSPGPPGTRHHHTLLDDFIKEKLTHPLLSPQKNCLV